MTKYPRNQWYVAGFDEELGQIQTTADQFGVEFARRQGETVACRNC